MNLELELDTNTWPSTEVQMLQSLLKTGAALDLPSRSPPPKRGADYLEYKIVVQLDGRIHTVCN